MSQLVQQVGAAKQVTPCALSGMQHQQVCLCQQVQQVHQQAPQIAQLAFAPAEAAEQAERVWPPEPSSSLCAAIWASGCLLGHEA